jgi:tetratricopeptide (TPR) repeat protein
MGEKAIIQCFIFILLILPFHSNAQDVNVLFKEAQQLEAAFKDPEALQKYIEILRAQPHNLTALCKASEYYSITGKRQPTKEKQKEYYRNARTYAQRALQVSPNNSAANCVMALAMGRMALIASGEERIKAVKDIKSYAEKSIQSDAANFKAWHVLGKWHYEVSDLSSIEKWLVKVAYESLPKASLDDAIKYYEKSKQLNPGFILNYLELAKAYHRKDNNKRAVELLETMMKLPNTFTDDASIKLKGKKFLEEWK